MLKSGESLLASNFLDRSCLAIIKSTKEFKTKATPALVNDLDIRITKNNETVLPLLLNPRH